jgi:hypothetical protein
VRHEDLAEVRADLRERREEAKKGLNGVLWRYQPSEPLTELRCVLALEPAVRVGRVGAVARMLRLEHLVSFFERSAVST